MRGQATDVGPSLLAPCTIFKACQVGLRLINRVEKNQNLILQALIHPCTCPHITIKSLSTVTGCKQAPSSQCHAKPRPRRASRLALFPRAALPCWRGLAHAIGLPTLMWPYLHLPHYRGKSSYCHKPLAGQIHLS